MPQIFFHGTRGSFLTSASTHARYGGHTSCVSVLHDNQWFIFDAGSGLIDADKIIHELLSHFNETATQITWGEDLNTSVSRILDTPLRETCSVLETFARFSQTENGKALIGDKAAKLAKTIVSARK